MSKLGDALGFGMKGEGDESPPSIPEDVGELDAKAEKPSGDAEVMAMDMFMKASTAEAKAEALKGFLSACGVMDY